MHFQGNPVENDTAHSLTGKESKNNCAETKIKFRGEKQFVCKVVIFAHFCQVEIAVEGYFGWTIQP